MSLKGVSLKVLFISLSLLIFLYVAFRYYASFEPSVEDPIQSTIAEAQSHIHHSDFRKGAEVLEKVLLIDPTLVEIHLRIAVLYDDYLAQDEMAAAHYKKYLSAVPDSQLRHLIQLWIKDASKEEQDLIEEDRGDLESEQMRDLHEKYQEVKVRVAKLDKLVLDQEKQLEQIGDLKQEIVVLKSRRRDLMKQLSDANSNIGSLRKQLEEKEQLIQDYKRRLNVFGSSYEEGVNRMEKELIELRTRNRQLTREMTDSEK